MKFNEFKIEKIDETELGVFYKGLTHNFYDLKEINLPTKEKDFANFLEKLIQRKASFSELSIFNLPDDFANDFRENIVSVVELNSLLEKIPSKKIFIDLLESLIRIISKTNIISNKLLFSEIVLHNSIGLKQLSFFSLEKDFEELMVNSLEEVFVFHKKFGVCKTNIILDEKKFNNILQRIAVSVGRSFDKKNPLLDAHLPDGSRVNATLETISPKGTTLTIRKFSSTPITIVDLIKNNTLSIESAAFLWMMVDGFGVNPKNILIIGGTACGKTTLLSVLSNFVRLSERVISIEDTLELDFFERDNWVAFEANHSMGEEIELDFLLKNALRMRPDRIIVGEVRGKEALTLFTAMDNGHSGCLGTIHSNNARDAINKLEERPFNVPKPQLALIDLIVVLKKNFSREKGISRSVSQIAEVSKMGEKILLANVFEKIDSQLVRTDLPSHIIEEFALQNSIEKNVLKKEIETRQLVLSWLVENNFSKPEDILEVIQSYYFDSEKVISTIYDSLK